LNDDAGGELLPLGFRGMSLLENRELYKMMRAPEPALFLKLTIQFYGYALDLFRGVCY